MKKERPLSCTDQEIRTLLDGSRTQIRRVVEFSPKLCADFDIAGAGNAYDFMLADDKGSAVFLVAGDHGYTDWVDCPYGMPGDRLWVQETWAHYQTVNNIRRHDGAASNQVSDGLAGYRADGFDSIEDFRTYVRQMSELDLEKVLINGDRWRSSTHMPRWASRITLEVTDVRVERVQDISVKDALDEGMNIDNLSCPDELCGGGHGCPRCEQYAVTMFEDLWDGINEKRGFGWDVNPWVWVAACKKVITKAEEAT